MKRNLEINMQQRRRFDGSDTELSIIMADDSTKGSILAFSYYYLCMRTKFQNIGTFMSFLHNQEM